MTPTDWRNIRAICCNDGIEQVSESEQARLEEIMRKWGWMRDDGIPGDVWTSEGMRACELMRDAERFELCLTCLTSCPLSRDNVIGMIEAAEGFMP